jgi:hypothetical protein
VLYTIAEPELPQEADIDDEDAIDAGLSAIGSMVSETFPAMCQDITRHMLQEIPALQGDELLERRLRASVDENVTAMLNMISLQVSPDNVAAPTAAAEYARRLAQRGISVIALVRSYRIAHARFLDWCVRELNKHGDAPRPVQAVIARVLDFSFRYIDRVSEQVVGAYQLERDRWLLTQTAVRASRVRKLLAGEELDLAATESTLGYRLIQHHVAVIGWVPEPTQSGDGLLRLDRLGQTLAADLGCTARPLFVPFDESIAWFWLPFGARPVADYSKISMIVESSDPTIRIGIGDVEKGLEGFRASHYQAVTAHNVANFALPPRRITLAEEVGPIALMCADIDATRVWVQKTLGVLATDERNHDVLRETLRVFFDSSGSYTTTAEVLKLHRNTVHYRVNKAQELLPSAISDRHSDIELALRACHQLGSVLLREAQ